jgi:DNA ligase-1
MLACDCNLAKLRYPVLASPKLDGVRAYVKDGVVLSRSNKPLPNRHVQQLFKGFEGFDGELIVGPPNAPDVYRTTVSGVMSHDGEPNVNFHVFDLATSADSYHTRYKALLEMHTSGMDFELLKQYRINSEAELIEYEQYVLSQGYEGVILRDPYAAYKQGRGSMTDQCLMKLKRFSDAEATVIGFEERMHNANEATVDERGYTKRSSHQGNKVPMGTLGALLVRNADGVEFAVGTGFDDAQRQEVWDNRDKYLGRVVKYKYFEIGVKDKPRHPVFLGWRDLIDM